MAKPTYECFDRKVAAWYGFDRSGATNFVFNLNVVNGSADNSEPRDFTISIYL